MFAKIYIQLGLLLLATSASHLAAADEVTSVFPLEKTISSLNPALTHEELAEALEQLESNGELRGRHLGQRVAELLVTTMEKAKPSSVLNEFSVEQLLELNSFAVMRHGEKPDTDCDRNKLANRRSVCERLESKQGGWALAKYCRACLADFVETCRDNIDQIYTELVLKSMGERDLQRIGAFSRELSELIAKTGGEDKLYSEAEEGKIGELLNSKAPFYRKFIQKNCSALQVELDRTIFAFEESIWMVLGALKRNSKLDKNRYLKLIGRCQTIERLAEASR